jgi:branched-chain amino acid transport system ATP-binding protein
MLDEPSSGVAQKETEALGPLLLRVRDRTGCSLVVIEHDMPLISTISDRMICLELGGIIAEGPPNEVLEHPQVIESYLGSDQSVIKRSGTGEAPAAKADQPPRRTRPLRATSEATAARSRAR